MLVFFYFFINVFMCRKWAFELENKGDAFLVVYWEGEMDSARSWLQKLQPRDKVRGLSRKKEAGSNGSTDDCTDEEGMSNTTKQKVAAAKQYIENHYKEQMKNLQERRERCVLLFVL